MTDEDAAFRRRIVEDHLDALPRLIYADWLEERASTKAELMRVDLIRTEWNFSGPAVIKGYKTPPGTLQRFRLERRLTFGDLQKILTKYYRISTILWANKDDLRAGITAIVNKTEWVGYANPRDVMLSVRHGFVESIEMNQNAFLQHAKRMFEAHPIRDICLTRVRPLPLYPQNVGWQMDGTVRGESRTAVGTAPGPMVHARIWERLAPVHGWGGNVHRQGTAMYKVYPTVESARIALSIACVDYGRSLMFQPTGKPLIDILNEPLPTYP